MGLRDKILGSKAQPPKAVEVTPSKPKIDQHQLTIDEIEILLGLVNQTTFKGADVARIYAIVSKLQNQVNKLL